MCVCVCVFVFHTKQFSAVLLNAEHINQLLCAIVCPLMVDQWVPKLVAAGVL